MIKKDLIDYKSMSEELDQILLKLQDPNTDIDEALTLYERGNTIVDQLNQHLKTAKNSIKRIKLNIKNGVKD